MRQPRHRRPASLPRVLSAAVLAGSALAVLATAASVASSLPSGAAAGGAGHATAAHVAGRDSGDLPLVSCSTDPNIFNTGYDPKTGGVLNYGSTDLNWVTDGPYNVGTENSDTELPADNPSPPSPDDGFIPAYVGNLVPQAWAQTPYDNAQWISHEEGTSPTGDWYYEYAFDLDSSVDPSTFSLDLDFLADNQVATVFVNGVDQSQYPESELPQSPYGTGDYSYTGFHLADEAKSTLDHDWVTGDNLIVVQVKSSSPYEGFDAQVRPSAFCPVGLTVTKSASPADYAPGQQLTYTVTVANSGPGSVADATISDPLPAALDGGDFTWTCAASINSSCTPSGETGSISDTPSVAAGGSVTYTVTGTVPQGTTGTIDDTATVTPPAGVTDSGCDPDCSATVAVPLAQPGLSLLKSVTSTGPYDEPGQTVDYQFVVANTGNVTMSAVGVDDVPVAPAGALTSGPTCETLSSPAGTCSGSSTTLEPGQSATFTGDYVLTDADFDNGSVSDSATASGEQPGCTQASCATASGSSSVTVDLAQAPGLSIVKSSRTASYSAPGDRIDYDFLLTNTGNVTLHGIEVVDVEAAPADEADLSPVACPSLVLAAGASETCTATYTVTKADLAHGSVSDTATASGVPPDSTAIFTQGSSLTVPASFALVTLEKSVATTTPAAHADDTFTLTASNAGPSASGQVVVTDDLASGLEYVSSSATAGTVSIAGGVVRWTVPDLAASGSDSRAVLTLTVAVDTTATVSNSASFTQVAPDGSGGFGGESNTVTLTPSYATVTIAKTIEDAHPVEGTDDTYVIVVHDSGPDAAAGVVVTDPLPAGATFVSADPSTGAVTESVAGGVTTLHWSVGALADGSSASLQVVVEIEASGGSLRNTATVTESSYDPAGQVATATAVASVVAGPTVPPVHTGEPWSGARYWLLVGVLGCAGVAALERERRRRRRRVLG